MEFHKPKVVFCENVKNLVNHDRGKTFKIIKKTLNDLGYRVFYKVINSKDFSVPQNRERIYIVAFREDISPNKFIFPEKIDDTKVIADIMEEKETSPKYYLSDVYLESLRKHKQRHQAKGNGFGYEIRDVNSIAGAIVCGGMGRERNLIIDKRLTDFIPVTHIKGKINREYIRKMTPREWARLQGFPDDFKLVVADTHLYKQFGNSVTVSVIKAIADNIKKQLEGVIIENVAKDKEYDEICNAKGSAFQIEKTEKFMKGISCYKLSAPARDKSDITMKIVDVNTGYSPTVGFSIKSELGSSPTLLNAGKTTNFIYKIIHNNPLLVKETNEIYKVTKGKKHTDVRGIIKRIIEENGQLEYIGMQNQTFSDNLVLIDSSMDNIIAETILYFYRDGISNCIDMVKKLEVENPMNYGNVNAYRYKFKKFLTAVALGMKPATIWDGIDEANGGYIIVTKQGDILAYHIYNRNYFEEYLLNNTKYETASTSRHDFGEVYSEDGEDFIKLNLQIRFR